MHTNPAMTGAVYRHQANVQCRNQLTGMSLAPTTLWANYAMKLNTINSGVGVSYEYDAAGLNQSHTALFSYAYHIPIKKMFLSLGISAGTLSKMYNAKGVTFVNPTYPTDPERKTYFQGDFGIALHGEKWNIGLSSTQMSGYFMKRGSSPYGSMVPYYWLFADYTFQLGENWKLTPRVQTVTDWNKHHSVFALIATVKNNLWFGGTVSIFRASNAGPMIGYDIAGKFRLGYTYQFEIDSRIRSVKNNGTHEMILSYQLK